VTRWWAAVRRRWQRLERALLGSVRYYRRRGARLGDVRAFSSPLLAEPHLCSFGNNVYVARHCVFLNHDGSVVMLHKMGLTDVVNVVGRIVVHDNVFIGMRSIILMDVEIGPNAIVAAGSVVTRDVPPNTVVAGCPARVICSLQEYVDKINDPERALWIGSEAHIAAEVTRYFMEENHRGRKAVRLRQPGTFWTR